MASDHSTSAARSPGTMPWSMARWTSAGALTLAAVQHRPTTTPKVTPAHCERRVRAINRHPARRLAGSRVSGGAENDGGSDPGAGDGSTGAPFGPGSDVGVDASSTALRVAMAISLL